MNLYRPPPGARDGEPCWALVKGQFPPLTQGELDYPCASTVIGVGLLSNPTQVYTKPENRAGNAKHMGEYYNKTGTIQNRLEPGFKGVKRPGALTEGYLVPKTPKSTRCVRTRTNRAHTPAHLLSSRSLPNLAATQQPFRMGSARSSGRNSESAGGVPAVEVITATKPASARSSSSGVKCAVTSRSYSSVRSMPSLYRTTNDAYGRTNGPYTLLRAGFSASGFPEIMRTQFNMD